MSVIRTPCGFDPNFFEILKLHFESLPEIARHGLLAIDEIGTRKGLLLDTASMSYKRLEDFGDGAPQTNLSEQADHGLVILFQPLAADFVQPVAVFASKGPTNGIKLSELIIQAIVMLEQAGAKIHGVVSDGASPNRKFWELMGCSGKKDDFNNYFCHPTESDRKVFLFSDTPHLIKTVRNRLFKKGTLRVNIQRY